MKPHDVGILLGSPFGQGFFYPIIEIVGFGKEFGHLVFYGIPYGPDFYKYFLVGPGEF